MPDQSPVLGLPYILPAQAQKHVTHNMAIQQLDTLVQLSVASASVSAPPSSPATGDRYIVATGATLDWLGQEYSIATWQGSGWEFTPPQAGWQAHVLDQNANIVFDGSIWGGETLDLQNLEGIGVNTTSDTTNKLAIAADATLLSHDGGGHQLKINKAASSDTASLLFQDNWSGRAEMGVAGDNDFRVKVSADGSSWQEALNIDKATGAVRFLETTGLAAPNLIRNPAFYAAQRGTGPFTSSGYTLDGFEISAGTTTPSITRETSDPASAEAAQNEYFLRYDNTGQATTYQAIKIRVNDLTQLSGTDLVLSFEARCDTAQTLPRVYYYQEFGSSGSPHAYAEFQRSIPIGTTWSSISTTANIASLSGQTLGAGHHLLIYISLSVGAPGLSGIFDIRRLKLERGTVSTPFLPSDPARDLAQSRYYFQRWHNSQNINDLAHQMRVMPSSSGAGPYDYSAEL
ncbi:MAG: DUF2793 domain-containing protein [Rhodobacteraceae bacterium]|nr:DUF2793 domain-containing protein [Paracoccaceae bacterium]